MKPHLEEAALMLRMADRDIAAFSASQIAALNPCAVRLRYDDVEIEMEYVTREELAGIVKAARVWAKQVFQTTSSCP